MISMMGVAPGQVAVWLASHLGDRTGYVYNVLHKHETWAQSKEREVAATRPLLMQQDIYNKQQQ
jgi:hypothetical protein